MFKSVLSWGQGRWMGMLKNPYAEENSVSDNDHLIRPVHEFLKVFSIIVSLSHINNF